MTPATEFKYLAAAAGSVNNTLVTDRPAIVTGIQGHNARTSAVYLTLFDKATAPAAGTDTPIKKLYLPASTSFAFDFPPGLRFAAGVGFALTTGGALTDNSAVTANDVLGLNIDYTR